jgi:hypothetical protein
MPLLQAFPFPSTLREVVLHPNSQACVFIYSSHGKWAFPPSCGIFLPLPLLQAFSLLVAGRVPPLLPSLASLFIYSSVRNCPPTLWHSECPALFAMCLFYCYCLLFSLVFSFFPGLGSVCPGGYAELAQGRLWEYRMLLSSPGDLLLPSQLGTGVWRCESPPGFSV